MQDETVRQKKMDKLYNSIPFIIREGAKEGRKLEEVARLRNEKLQAEKEKQEKVGIVGKPSVIGRFKYKMKKTDFQLEEELAPTLRQLKPQGTDDLLRDRYDSVFRRNFIELDAPTVA